MMNAIEPAMNLSQMPLNEQLALRTSAFGGSQLPMNTRAYNQVYQPPMMPGAPAQGQGLIQQLLPYAMQAGATYAGSPAGAAAIGGLFSKSQPTPQQSGIFGMNQMTGQVSFNS
jgi:hypothetical protein